MIPQLRPAASITERIMWAVVVLPLVPVTPIMVMRFAGLPKKLQLISAKARRLEGTWITVTPWGVSSSLCWITSTPAPLVTTSAA